MDERLRELKVEFMDLKNISKVQDVAELMTISNIMQEQKMDMKRFTNILSEKIEKEKVMIKELQDQLVSLKYQTKKKEETREQKLEYIENKFIEKREQMFNKESEVLLVKYFRLKNSKR